MLALSHSMKPGLKMSQPNPCVIDWILLEFPIVIPVIPSTARAYWATYVDREI